MARSRGRPINYDSAPPANGIAYRGFDRVERQIKHLQDFVTKPSDPSRKSLVASLLDIGEAYASSKIGPGEDVEIEKRTISKEGSAHEGWGLLRATGDDILFWEFGTGVTLSPGTHPRATMLNIEPASFSATHAGWLVGEKLAKYKGKWPYRGQWTYGQPPRMAMWVAAKVMREAIPGLVAQISIFEK